jgi:nicotinate-nucleotide adenylyltransferase
MSGRERIGLFGGTFDPIHTGHLILAEAASDFIGIDRVLFIPTAFPPNKRDRRLTDIEARSRMVELAIADNPRFELSAIERRDEIAYTSETVRRFADAGYRQEELHLLVGSDSLEEIGSWKEPGVIFSLATIVAQRRPGFHGLTTLPDGAAVIMIETGSNSISSSEIRRLAAAGRSIRYLVPAPVERYIDEHALYSGSV